MIDNLVETAVFLTFCPALAIQYSNPDEIDPVTIGNWPTAIHAKFSPSDREFTHAAGFAAARC